MNYYFFAATLPVLSLDNPPPLSSERFRKLCAEHLSTNDLRALDEILTPTFGDSKHSFVRAWRHREIQLRNALARTRAARLSTNAASYLKDHEGYDTYIEKTASDAFSKTNPLDRELALDKFRWSQIEDLAGYDCFSTRPILAYALKLRLAERWAAMTEEKGGSVVDEMVNRQPGKMETHVT